jgi:hypothetical protein
MFGKTFLWDDETCQPFKLSMEIEIMYCPVAFFILSTVWGLMFNILSLRDITMRKGHLGLNLTVWGVKSHSVYATVILYVLPSFCMCYHHSVCVIIILYLLSSFSFVLLKLFLYPSIAAWLRAVSSPGWSVGTAVAVAEDVSGTELGTARQQPF